VFTQECACATRSLSLVTLVLSRERAREGARALLGLSNGSTLVPLTLLLERARVATAGTCLLWSTHFYS
jgi:hypothetical protein